MSTQKNPSEGPTANDAGMQSAGMGKGAQITIGASLIVALLGWFAYTNLGGEASFQYYQTLDEMLVQRAALEGRSLRVHGYVANESIDRDLERKEVRFAVRNDPPHAGGAAGAVLDVVFQGLDTPDMFKDGAEVVVEGRLTGEVFVADNVLAKCPSKFEGGESATTLGGGPMGSSLKGDRPDSLAPGGAPPPGDASARL